MYNKLNNQKVQQKNKNLKYDTTDIFIQTNDTHLRCMSYDADKRVKMFIEVVQKKYIERSHPTVSENLSRIRTNNIL